MDPVTAKLMSAAGAAADPVYVDDVFSTFLYDGTGSALTITNGIDLSGEGGLVWLKSRGNGYGWRMVDTERGATKALESYDPTAEATESNGLTAFTSTGFSVGTQGHYNGSGYDMASFTFRKCPGFFDVVTYTGNGVEDSNGLRTISHNLGAKIGFIAIKNLSTYSDWVCAHTDVQYPYYLRLNTNEGSQGGTISASPGYIYLPNNTTNFQIGNGGSASAGLDLNINNNNYVAYIWALGTDSDSQVFGDGGDEAIIKCGSYDPGQSATTVNLGFEPQWVLIKNADVSSQYANWMMFDNMRGVVTGGNELALAANMSNSEGGGNLGGSRNYIDFTSTGFIADPDNSQFTAVNSDGGGVDNFI